MNLFYRLMVNGIAPTLDFKINEAINTLENYDKFDKPNLVELEDGIFSGEELYIKKEKENKTVYDLFFKNLHIHVSCSNTERIFSVRLKRDDESWSFKINEDVFDFAHPINQTYEVYVWYKVPVLDITTSVGYIYKSGTWNKYFYKTINEFFNSVENVTDETQFNEAYK